MSERSSYVPRLSDAELKRKLQASGALLIRGIKACGKTASALQCAASSIAFDRDPQVEHWMELQPERLLIGETPRLIDEWQEFPRIWNYIRHEVDKRDKMAQFILTGSAHPEESVKLHSGAGRFTVMNMRTMSWQEMGYSSAEIKLSDLFESKQIEIVDHATDLGQIVERMIKGGFPALLNKNLSQAIEINRSYVDLMAEVDIGRIYSSKRDPQKVRSLLRSLARNTATLVEISTIAEDMRLNEVADMSRPTIYNYLDALERLMIIENQLSWDTHIRSSASLRKAPKRHFADVSLAVAILGATKETLFKDLNFTGFLFESQVVHDLRVYAQVLDANVYHYSDSSGLEVDAIVQKYTGEWCAFEIKLGTAHIDAAANSLLKLASKIDQTRVPTPASLNVITGTGMSYTRKDGVNVISLSSLGV